MLARSLLQPFRSSLRTASRSTQPTNFFRFSNLSQPTKQFPQRRYASQWPGGGRRNYQYSRFSRAQQTVNLWRVSPVFRTVTYTAAGGTGVFVVTNIETVPESGRKRFNWVSPSYERELGVSTYQSTLQEYRHKLLPASHPHVRLAQRVVTRLLPHSGLQDEALDWEVHVIDSPEANAFVIPGGKVFVFSGILPICGSEAGLAAVLGHEIAHNVAHHVAENVSLYSFLAPLAWAASFVFDVSGQLSMLVLDLALKRPGSRTQESEADWMGLMMMSRACYDPREAELLWQRMEEYEKQRGGSVPAWLSTHPTNRRRIADIGKWLPEAEGRRDESGCGATAGWAEDFKRAIPSGLGGNGNVSASKGSSDGDFW